MPQAPILPPDQMQQAQASAGINPANFLIAAADMHGAGQLSSPVPRGRDPLAKAGRLKPTKHVQVVK
jgi:hypothetical protein